MVTIGMAFQVPKHRMKNFIVPLSISKKLLVDFWSTRYRNLVPCENKYGIKWTCEHVVPRSLVREHDDMHNLILFPARMNHLRANKKYSELPFDLVGQPLRMSRIPSCHPCQCSQNRCKACGWNHNDFFVPPDYWKGVIARSTMYMAQKYPRYQQLIHNRVLDVGTATLWDMHFPPTKSQKQWDDLVQHIQKDTNPFLQKWFTLW